MHCLKPKLKAVPEGDWYCNECKPKHKVRSPKKKSRRAFDEDQEDQRVEEDEEEDEVDEESDRGEEGDGEEEEAEEEAEEEGEEEQEAEEEEGGNDSDVPVITEDEDEEPLKRAKRKRVTEPAPKKSHKRIMDVEEDGNSDCGGSNGALSSLLLGKRRCATEASVRIARVALESHSGHSSGSESVHENVATSRSSTRATRATRAATGKRSLDNGYADPNPQQSSSSSTSSARSKRRRAVDDKIESMFSPVVLEDLVNGLIRHRDGWPFDRPITKVTRLGLTQT